MGPRWKNDYSEAKALANPMSKIVLQLQSSLCQSNSTGLLLGYDCVLIEVENEQAQLLANACFGKHITSDVKNKQLFQFNAHIMKNKQLFQLSWEEAFYLWHSLKCITLVCDNNCPKTDEDLWKYMKSKKETFPHFYKAYSHLRMKNWVVRPGSLFGVDFVAYRHHPDLVHSEYAGLVLSEGDGDKNDRLRVWSDIQCTIRLSGNVAKTLLVLYVNKNGHNTASPSCLERYSIEERSIIRWSHEQNRDDQIVVENE